MAKLEIPVQVYMDNLDEMIDELKQLQTYVIKLYGCDEKGLVDCDEVVKIFRKHLRTKVGKSEIIIRCKDCKHYRECEIFGRKITLCKRREYDALSVEPDDFCSYAERRTDEVN